MPIYRKHRALSEKTTSIEDPIEVVQRGIISFVPSKACGAFLVPTQITNPVGLRITPMSSMTAQALNCGSVGGTHIWSDLTLYYATAAASSCFGSLASLVTPAEIGRRLRIYNGHLYVATASLAATSAENTELSTTASIYWRKLDEFGSNAKKYLKVVVPNTSSAYFIKKKQLLAFEVVGYEY